MGNRERHNIGHPGAVCNGAGNINTPCGRIIYDPEVMEKLDAFDWAQSLRLATLSEGFKNFSEIEISWKVMNKESAKSVYQQWCKLLEDDESKLIQWRPSIDNFF